MVSPPAPSNAIRMPISRSQKRALLFGLILALTIVPRLWLLLSTLDRGLGVDELQSATHAYLPLGQLIKSVNTFDPHPPLYYIQLHFWLWIGNTSDIWLKLNPFFWSVLTALSIYIVASKIYGINVGVLATILYAIAPYSIADAQSVRMYSMIACLGIWVFFFTHQFIVAKRSLWMGLGMFLSTLAFLYSQGAGFIILSSSISYALLIAWQSHTSKPVLAKWGIIQLAIIFLYLPWLFHARAISVEHTLVPTMADITYTFSQLLFGVKIVLVSFKNWIYIISFLMACLIMLTLSFQKDSRILAVAFIVLPILTCLFFSYFVKPIWLTRTLAHIVPFICLGMAIAAIGVLRAIPKDNILRKMPRFGFAILLGIFIVSSTLGLFYQQDNFLPWSNLLQPVQLVKANASDSDVVYIPNGRIYWGWCWYYIGPGSVNPLNTNYDNLVAGVRITSGASMPNPIEGVKTVWVVYRTYDGDLTGFFDKLPDYSRQVAGTFRDVIVEKLTLMEKK